MFQGDKHCDTWCMALKGKHDQKPDAKAKNKEPRIWMILRSLTAFQSKVLWFGGSIVNICECCRVSIHVWGGLLHRVRWKHAWYPIFLFGLQPCQVLLWPVSCWMDPGWAAASWWKRGEVCNQNDISPVQLCAATTESKCLDFRHTLFVGNGSFWQKIDATLSAGEPLFKNP